MKRGQWLAALAVCVLVGPKLSAQGWVLPPPVGAVVFGQTWPVQHHHHHFAGYSRYLVASYGLGYTSGYPFGLLGPGPNVIVYNSPSIVIQQPAVVNQPTLPAGLDLAALRRKGIILPGEDDADQPPPPRKPPLPKPPAPESPGVRQLAGGKAAFASKQYGLAERRFRQATTLPVIDPLTFFLLAQAEFALGKYAQAVEAIETGLRLRPDWPHADFHALDLYDGHATEFTAQLDRLRDTAARFPRDATVLFLLGYEEWFAGRTEPARDMFQRAAALAPERAAIRAFLAAGRRPH